MNFWEGLADNISKIRWADIGIAVLIIALFALFNKVLVKYIFALLNRRFGASGKGNCGSRCLSGRSGRFSY